MFTIYNNGIVDFKSNNNPHYNKVEQTPSSTANFELKDEIAQYFNKREKEKSSAKKEEYLSSYKKVAQINQSNNIYFVKDIMATNFISIENSATLKDAYLLMEENKITQMPIVNEDKKIVALLDYRFILNTIIKNLKTADDLLDRRLWEFKFPETVTTHPETELKELIKIMFTMRLGLVSVVDDEGVLVGLVSKSYIFQALGTFSNLEFWT